MHSSSSTLLFLLPALGSCAALNSARATAPKWTTEIVGNTTTNFANVARDGGGGGRVAGINLINFSDTSTFVGPLPSDGKCFASNSLAISGYGGAGPEVLQDFGHNGCPKLEVPFFPDEPKSAIWPNSAISPACNGSCGIAFYGVFNRTADNKLMYNTAVNITINSTGVPNAERPVQALFGPHEVQYGSFSSLAHDDGHLYLFGGTKNVTNPGLRMARVADTTPFDRSTYEFWNGYSWATTIPPYDDGGASNIYNWTGDGLHSPASGDVFFSKFYNTYMILFQGLGYDARLWMSYSMSGMLHTGWSYPQVVMTTPAAYNYNYAIHAYPHFDDTQRVIPVSFCQQIGGTSDTGVFGTYIKVGWANITFS